jgi:hypothetical protein
MQGSASFRYLARPVALRYKSTVPIGSRAFPFLISLPLCLAAIFLAGCASGPSGIEQARIENAARISSEAPGDYFVGRRYFKTNFKFWGYVRRPGQPWSTSQLVMLNEKQKLAPDREANSFGSDNNYEYKLYGDFSGDTVYEPASNAMYPEFVLKNYELISTSPPPIFKSQVNGRAQAAVGALTIEKPE